MFVKRNVCAQGPYEVRVSHFISHVTAKQHSRIFADSTIRTYIFWHLHKQCSSCRSCQNLGLQTENRLAKQNSDIIHLWLHSVSFEFNCLQTFVRTFHLSDGQTEPH